MHSLKLTAQIRRVVYPPLFPLTDHEDEWSTSKGQSLSEFLYCITTKAFIT